MKKRFDRTLKQVIPKELKPYYDPQDQVKIDYPISQEGFTIDLVFERISSQEIKQVNFPPFLLTPHLCFQLKHAGFTLSFLELDQFLGQISIYKSKEKLKSYKDVSLVVVVSNISQELLEKLDDYAFKMVKDGVYLEETRFRTVVIVSNQLAVIPENYPYLLISEGDRRREFLERILVEGNHYYVAQAYKLYREEVRTMADEKGMDLEKELTPKDLIEDFGAEWLIKGIIEDFGAEWLIKGLVKDFGVDGVIKALAKDFGKDRIIEVLETE